MDKIVTRNIPLDTELGPVLLTMSVLGEGVCIVHGEKRGQAMLRDTLTDMRVLATLELGSDKTWIIQRTEKGNEAKSALDVRVPNPHGRDSVPAGKKIRDKVRSVILAAVNAYFQANPGVLVQASIERAESDLDNVTTALEDAQANVRKLTEEKHRLAGVLVHLLIERTQGQPPITHDVADKIVAEVFHAADWTETERPIVTPYGELTDGNHSELAKLENEAALRTQCRAWIEAFTDDCSCTADVPCLKHVVRESERIMNSPEAHRAALAAIPGEIDMAGPEIAPKLHPFCKVCGWRKGGVDSWDGNRCKCGLSEPPMPLGDPTLEG